MGIHEGGLAYGWAEAVIPKLATANAAARNQSWN